MIGKQIIRSSLRALKASTPASASPYLAARLPVLSALRPAQSTQFDATPLRWISSSCLRADEAPQSSEAPPTETANSSAAPQTEELVAVYLSNLSFSVTEELLTEFISQYAPVKKVDVVRSNDGAARG